MVKRFSKLIADTRGDTIVEVLISVAVVTLVLAGAYASTRTSVRATRTAQERGEALKIAESQVEQIKIAANAGTPNIIGAGNFCLSGGTLDVTPPCTTTNGIDYQTQVSHVVNSHEFSVKVTWSGLTSITNNVELEYKTQ